jgi:lysophospholipase L1-like esterase
MKSALEAIVKGLITTIIFFLLAEAGLRAAYFVRNSMVQYVPLPYAFGDDYGPIPPWLDRLLILKSDDALIWKNEPNVRRKYLDVFNAVPTEQDRIALLRRFVPTVPAEFRSNPTWDVRINSEGFRGGEMPLAHTPSVVRIACIGDSWTFGMPVGQDQAYPSRLAEWLRQEQPKTMYEVDNFGVLGYSSFQGLRLMKSQVLDRHPDIVVIGFGMNDSEVAGYRDKDIVSDGSHPSIAARVKEAIKGAAESSEDYKLLKYEALVLRYRPKPIGDYLKAEADAKGSDPVDYDSIEPWTRVSPRDYEANLREMIRLATAGGARVVLLDNELWDGSPYRPVLRKLSSELNVPLVDSLAILNEARKRIEGDLETRLGLGVPGKRGRESFSSASPKTTPDPFSPPAGKRTVVFRVYRGSVAVPKQLSIVGEDPALGGLAPNTVAMHDDGKDGDQRAGDGVWSYAAALPAGRTAFYVYTNSGATGKWEGLDVPHIRRVSVPATVDADAPSAPVYLPIETFGRVYLQGDDWHTDATGYDAIAHAVARAVAVRP